MRLYKMELYKLCHRKLFKVGAGCTAALLILFFWMRVSQESSYVDGVSYQGYQAVQMDKKIMEEFKGVITDEKVGKIVEKYGFPKEVKENYPYYQDSNFLNEWVEQYLSDGYYRGWDNYKIASFAYPLADTEAGEAAKTAGKDIVLAYNNGWSAFCDILTFGLIVGSVLILFGVSIVFANEGQTKMLPLIFTTKDGKEKDIYVKIAAAFTVAVGVWLGVVLLDYLLCNSVYGFDGRECMVGMMGLSQSISSYYPLSMLSADVYTAVVLFRSLLGILLLCSVTIYLSAHFPSCFHAVVSAALSWMAPVLVFMFTVIFDIGGGMIVRLIRSVIVCFIYASPIYLVRFDSIIDCYGSWRLLACISAAGIVQCMVSAYRKYKKLV
ncbi:MAG: ABC transporter permease [Clostridium sp.]|nr:ABC transporter permease [Clostridium sp.]